MLSTPTPQRPLIVGGGQAQADRLARPRRHVHARLGRLAAGRIAWRGVEDVDQHIALGHRVDGRRRTEEVDAELLVRLGSVIGQGRWAAEGARPGVEDGQLQGEATLQPQVPVQDAGSGAVHVGHRREPALGRIGDIEGGVGIALGGIGRLVAVGVHEPAPRAAADGLPTSDRAGLEVLHDDRPRPSLAPDEDRAQCDEGDQRCRSDRAPATPEPARRAPRWLNRMHGHLAHPRSTPIVL